MSDYSAIGGVSATLQILLKDRMQLPPDIETRQDLIVSIGLPPPDSEDGETPEDPRVNLFLYRMEKNGSLANQEDPGKGVVGAYGKPPLTLNLYYLVTTYGSKRGDGGGMNETLAHFLLGSAMRVLHDYAIIPDDLETINENPGETILYESLRGEFENINITLEPVSLEDLSKVWTAISRAYRVSAVYKVSVVRIESRLVRTYPRLVGEPPDAGPRLYTVPFARPRITDLRIRRQGDASNREQQAIHACIGDTLIIRGTDFSRTGTRLLIGSVDATDDITKFRPDRIEVSLPDDAALQPGPVTVRVETKVEDLPQTGFPSNEFVFMLAPRITSVVYDPGTRKVTITGTRLYAEDGNSLAMVDDATIPAEDYTTADPMEITFNLDEVPAAGSHTVRVQVNRAQTLKAATFTVV